MPILLKKIDAQIISFINNEDSDFLTIVTLIKPIIGQVGIDDYILTAGVEGFVQDFSNVIESEFCVEAPTNIGSLNCTSHENLNISF